jgi:hypothetical protein
VESPSRISQFYAAVVERFPFLWEQGFRVADRASYGDRFESVRFESGGTQMSLSWDAYDGCLEAKVGDVNLWPLVTAAGLWDAGRHRDVYAGASIEAMQHGLDRIATFLTTHPGVLSDQ